MGFVANRCIISQNSMVNTCDALGGNFNQTKRDGSVFKASNHYLVQNNIIAPSTPGTIRLTLHAQITEQTRVHRYDSFYFRTFLQEEARINVYSVSTSLFAYFLKFERGILRIMVSYTQAFTNP